MMTKYQNGSIHVAFDDELLIVLGRAFVGDDHCYGRLSLISSLQMMHEEMMKLGTSYYYSFLFIDPFIQRLLRAMHVLELNRTIINRGYL